MDKKMCWNYAVSLSFSILYLLTNSYYIINKPLYWQEYLLFGFFYFCMEVFQTMQWLFGNVYNDSLLGIEHCDLINQNFTIIAHILIWLQPILFSYIGYRTSNNKNFFKYYLPLTGFVFIFSLILLMMGFSWDHYYSINNSIFGLSTCTNKGATGHLVWRFKPSSIDYFPNYFTYLILCILSFLMYDKEEMRLIGFGWIVSLISTKIILRPHLLEIASSWCLLSIIANIIIVTHSMTQRQKFSTKKSD